MTNITPEMIAAMLSEDATKTRHAEAYPVGCGIAGHRCEACQQRLAEPPHPTRRRITQRGRPGYRERGEQVCDQRGCAWYGL